MAKFQPQVTIRKANQVGTTTIKYKTYRELLKNLKPNCEENIEVITYVYRSKRGEWGEWFENWVLDADGNPYIDKQGWS
jgi:hypothetical protein